MEFGIGLSLSTMPPFQQTGASPFNPSDLSNLALWLDGADITKMGFRDGGSNYIATWQDKSGNGNDAVQSTEADQPLYVLGDKNSHNVLEFDSDYLDVAISLPQPHTLFLVGKNDPNQNQYYIDGTVANERLAIYMTGFNEEKAFVSGTSFGYLTADANWHSHRVVANGASSLYQRDDETAVLASAGTATVPGLRIGASVATGDKLVGKIAEIIIYQALLSAEDTASVNEYLSLRWGL